MDENNCATLNSARTSGPNDRVRSDATTDGDRPGSGVGLFAARRLMAGMGGRLWIEDKLAGGTQFVAALPAAGGAEPKVAGIA